MEVEYNYFNSNTPYLDMANQQSMSGELNSSYGVKYVRPQEDYELPKTVGTSSSLARMQMHRQVFISV